MKNIALKTLEFPWKQKINKYVNKNHANTITIVAVTVIIINNNNNNAVCLTSTYQC